VKERNTRRRGISGHESVGDKKEEKGVLIQGGRLLCWLLVYGLFVGRRKGGYYRVKAGGETERKGKGEHNTWRETGDAKGTKCSS